MKADLGRCSCGAQIVRVEAGRRTDGTFAPVLTWKRCARGHVLEKQEIPTNLGSRA